MEGPREPPLRASVPSGGMFWGGREEDLSGLCIFLDSYSFDVLQLHSPLLHSSSAAGLPVGLAHSDCGQ